jgi:hypothetical protein
MMEQDPHDHDANGRHHPHPGNGKTSNGGDRRDQPAPQQQQPQAAKPAQAAQQAATNRTSRRNRLSDQVDDEPPLRGYKRYVRGRFIVIRRCRWFATT